MKTLTIKPDPSQTLVNKDVDSWLTKEFMRHGAPGSIIGKDFSVPDMGNKQIIRIVKLPGSDVHTFPAELAEIGQAVANHQYGISPAAHDKLCFMLYRKATLGNKLLADEWHGHAFPNQRSKLMKTIAFTMAAIQCQKIVPALFNLNFDLSLNEYLISNIEPTLYQKETAVEDLNITRQHRGMIPQNPEYIPAAQAEENSLLFITSRVFHSAPTYKDIAPENIGKERRFIDISYVPTNKVADYIID